VELRPLGGGCPPERRLVEEAVATEAGISVAAIRVQDPEDGATTGRTGAVASHDDLRPLSDHIPPEMDPAPPSELEADPRRLADRTREPGGKAGRLEHDEADPRPPGEGGEPTEAVREALRSGDPGWEIDDQQVDRTTSEERAGDRDPLVRGRGGHDDEPLETDAPGDGLDRVEGRGEVEPRDDRAGSLRLGDEPEGEGRPPAREVAADREAHPARETAGAEDRVEGREAGREDVPVVATRDLVAVRRRGPERRRGEGADDGGRSGTPAGPKARQGRRDIGGKSRHAT
jgi:hypothetical protein